MRVKDQASQFGISQLISHNGRCNCRRRIRSLTEKQRDFNAFIARMENHFFRYSSYFTTDERKVAGEGPLDALLLKWVQHENGCTWQESYFNRVSEPDDRSRT
jgi:hypothetical protein